MLDSARKIDNYTSGVSKKMFLVNQEKQSAIILQLMLIGETSKKLSEEIKSQIDLPWKQIAGFRDIAIHDYVNLNLDVVWEVTQKRIPVLKVKLEEFLNNNNNNNN